MKSWCMRCNKQKQGVHEVLLLGIQYFICNACATKIANLQYMYRASKNIRFKDQLEYMMFHAVGFSKK